MFIYFAIDRDNNNIQTDAADATHGRETLAQSSCENETLNSNW